MIFAKRIKLARYAKVCQVGLITVACFWYERQGGRVAWFGVSLLRVETSEIGIIWDIINNFRNYELYDK